MTIEELEDNIYAANICIEGEAREKFTNEIGNDLSCSCGYLA